MMDGHWTLPLRGLSCGRVTCALHGEMFQGQVGVSQQLFSRWLRPCVRTVRFGESDYSRLGRVFGALQQNRRA